MTTDYEAFARSAYGAYAAVTDWKNFQGNPMPVFGDLPDKIRLAWIAAAKDVLVGAALTVLVGAALTARVERQDLQAKYDEAKAALRQMPQCFNCGAPCAAHEALVRLRLTLRELADGASMRRDDPNDRIV